MSAIIGTSVQEAIHWLASGQPVALPTETVYGLAAPLDDVSCIKKIYALKQRPANNPLIVHVLGIEQLQQVAEVSPLAEKLVQHFWPGPLTLVLKRKEIVPNIVTAGQTTVAVRSPQNPLFREVIRTLGQPLVAPSANKFQHISPTSAQQVSQDMGDVLNYILNGGPCQFGLESTILSLLNNSPTLLRPGPISKEQLQDFLSMAIKDRDSAIHEDKPLLSPGLYKKHYSPKTPLYWIEKLESYQPTEAYRSIFEQNSAHVFLMPPNRTLQASEFVLSPQGDLQEAAAHLFSMLQHLDMLGFQSIWIEKAPNVGIGRAINDRLSRAAHFKV